MLVDLLDEEAQEGEQVIPDKTDDKIASRTVHLQCLILRLSTITRPSLFIEFTLMWRLSCWLNHLDKELWAVAGAIESMSSDEEVHHDTCLLSHHQEQLGDLNSELANVLQELLSTDWDDTTLSEQHAQLSQVLFDARLKIKHLLQKHDSVPTLSSGPSSVKLPKPSVPVFDGNIVNWCSFWEQCTMSVHDWTGLSLLEKLTYLKQAVKDVSTKHCSWRALYLWWSVQWCCWLIAQAIWLTTSAAKKTMSNQSSIHGRRRMVVVKSWDACRTPLTNTFAR